MNFPRIYSIHDQAITVEFDQQISEEINARVISLHHAITTDPFEGWIESVPAYASLTVYFSRSTNKNKVIGALQDKINTALSTALGSTGTTKIIPVCYDPAFGIDLAAVMEQTGLSSEKIINLHTSQRYRVYMIGFIPGFPYMGILPATLEVPRKKTPSVQIPAGSVAIAGKQTGIYPSSSPGGWQVIGRTPVKMFDKQASPCTVLVPGDLVQFQPITRHEFETLA